MLVEIVLFGDGHLKQAAAVVAARYRASRDFVQFPATRSRALDGILPHLRVVARGRPGVAVVRDSWLVVFCWPPSHAAGSADRVHP
jgi:hypothetical protein